jgi:hypothetical protein
MLRLRVAAIAIIRAFRPQEPAMNQPLLERLATELDALKSAGPLQVRARHRVAAAGGDHLQGGREVINLCANNYLGLANHPELIAAAHEALDRYGYGMASVRFICGTQTPHKELERRISAFLGTEDTILYPSCFDANGGLFETLLGPEDAVDQRPAQPRLHHRRHPLVQGAALPLPAQRHGRPRDEARRGQGRPRALDCHRRRVLDGRHDR